MYMYIYVCVFLSPPACTNCEPLLVSTCVVLCGYLAALGQVRPRPLYINNT